VRVVIFSDHPLRQAQWCTEYAPYIWDHCVPDEKLIDDRVPVIVAGSTTLDLSDLETNLTVFGLATGWKHAKAVAEGAR
jgi:hypothetical protein